MIAREGTQEKPLHDLAYSKYVSISSLPAALPTHFYPVARTISKIYQPHVMANTSKLSNLKLYTNLTMLLYNGGWRKNSISGGTSP